MLHRVVRLVGERSAAERVFLLIMALIAIHLMGILVGRMAAFVFAG